jgi:hypothetical protein
MVRGSIVDSDTYLLESRVLFELNERGTTQLILEGFHQRRTDLGFGGIGPDPQHDARNAFLPGREGSAGVFLEARQRVIATLGARTSENVEVLVSQSFQRRTLQDVRGKEDVGLGRTFEPGGAPGAYRTSERLYSELAMRRDSRAVRGPPSPGTLFEAYGGTSEDAHDAYAPAWHAGGRFGWFLPVVHGTTILSPRASLDVIAPRGDRPLPFREYSYSSGFRGADGRVDRVAATVSVDHRWQLVPYIAARLFVDLTTVAPTVQALRADHLAWAVGGGVDLHSSTTEVGRIGLSYSAAAVQLLLTFGIAGPGFGDRQHR